MKKFKIFTKKFRRSTKHFKKFDTRIKNQQLTSISRKSRLICSFFMLNFPISSCVRSISDNWSGESSSSLPFNSRLCVSAISSWSSLILALNWLRSASCFAFDFLSFSSSWRVEFKSISEEALRNEEKCWKLVEIFEN